MALRDIERAELTRFNNHGMDSRAKLKDGGAVSDGLRVESCSVV